ncbi:glutathione biosynthesis bifunctional protein [Acrasis kona]|uniref:Glutathione biosynthesis bifunctional protein n=1 Tax=Acrasis kona TaxID=1008807 RepID=A0AAW2ZKR5_9EUKA
MIAVRQEEDPITKAKLYQKWADLYYDKAKAMPEDNMTARTLKSIELESAIPLYDKCIELLPKADADLRKEFISAYYNRASSLRKNTEFNDSLAKDELTAVYEKILNDYISINTLDPSLLHIHEHLGDMYAKLEQPVEAIHEYGELDKKLEEFLRSDYANAIKNKDIYVMELYLKLATQYIPKKDFDMCEHYVNSVLESFTKVPGYEERVRQLKAIAHHTVGRCALVMNRYHSCIAHNTKAIAADSSFAPAYRDRIISFEKLDRPDEAIDDKKMLEYITRKIVFERK